MDGTTVTLTINGPGRQARTVRATAIRVTADGGLAYKTIDGEGGAAPGAWESIDIAPAGGGASDRA